MGAFREFVREARGILHETMSVPAVYFSDADYVEGETETKQITVRVHDKFMALGDQKGTSFNYAEIESISPRIIFWLSEFEGVSIERGFVVSVEPGIAYRLDSAKEKDDQTQTFNVAKIPVAKTAGFPLPVIA